MASMSQSDQHEANIDKEFFAKVEDDGFNRSDSEGYSSYLSSAEDEGSSSSSEMSSDSEDTEARIQLTFWETALLVGPVSAIRRRSVVNAAGAATRVSSPSSLSPDAIHDEENDLSDIVDDDSKTRRSPLYSHRCSRLHRECCPDSIGKLINLVLVLSLILWVLSYLFFHGITDFSLSSRASLLRRSNAQLLLDKLVRRRTQLTPGQMARLRADQRRNDGLLGKAEKGFANFYRGPAARTRRQPDKGHVEDLEPGCEFNEWQRQSFPTCNEIHEIDLRDAFHLHKYSVNIAIGENVHASEEAQLEAERVGYVGSGLWRHVWKIDPRNEMEHDMKGEFKAPSVLKMMKGEHDFNTRNMDRHRRDALVMERLTSSPYIVSIYAYCGNSVLTEFVGADLEEIILKVSQSSNDNALFPTRATPEGRLRLALDVARGISAIHSVQGIPIIHADIQTKQFLVDGHGRVKLNDFNRCRFIPHRNTTGEPCEVRIPTAPGATRSPEEYEIAPLTEKLDIYSLGHVMYTILQGEEPWSRKRTADIKELVKAGERPPIDEGYLIPNTTDAGLAALIDLAYEKDPMNRISASELVEELEILLRKTRHA